MIEIMVVTKTKSPWSDKVFNYARRYVATGFNTVDDLIAYYEAQGISYGVGYSATDDYVTYHFPAAGYERCIYRIKLSEINNRVGKDESHD